MASVVDLLFSKVVSSEDVLQWLTDPEYLPGHSELELTGLRRSDFIANFVNFIRDQCPLIQQSSSPAQPRQPSPAPVKVWSTSAFKSKGPGDVVQNSKLESVLCSRSRPSAGGRRQNTARVFGGNGQTSTYVTPVTRRDLPRTGATDAAGQETVPRRTDRRVASKEVFTSAVFAESAFVPDFGDSGVFPAVGTRAVEKPRPIRRITPTPVKSQWRKLTLNDFLPPEVAQEHHRGENSRPARQHHHKEGRESTRSHFRTDALQQNRITTPVGCKDEPQGVDASVSQEPPEEVQPEEYVVPVPQCTTDREKLDVLAAVYAALLNRGLIVNITVELFFLLQLLTAKQKVGSVEEDGSTKLLHSVHNCTHFAVAVLRDILPWLRFLDKPTLKLLSNVQHLTAFSPTLHSGIVILCECVAPMSRVWPSSIEGVAFDDSTDSREHFLSDSNFRAFRKQRDLFYSLFRDWKRHQFGSGESFAAHFPRRVAEILNTCSEPCNLSHLARLVLGQLMTSCCGGLGLDEEGNIDEKFLLDLKSASPQKMEKLQERFLQPFKVGGPCPSHCFTGSQIFFYEFCKFAANSIFLQHFKDQCVWKIVEFEADNPFQDAEEPLGEDVRKVVIAALYKFKLLGLFLGVVEFLPYSANDGGPKKYKDEQQTIRNLKPLPLNISGIVKASVKTRQLAATLTWVVNFLSMMDPIAKTLNAYKDVLGVLFSIYRSVTLMQASKVTFFARVMLGWLFEVQCVQSDVFACFSNSVLVRFESLGSFVDGCMIYMCCPYLGELRCILLEHLAGRRPRFGEIRKITPVSANESDVKTQLSSQLEENFFHIHPLSMRKTVDFVAERVSSNVAKALKKDVQAAIASSRDVLALEGGTEADQEEQITKLLLEVGDTTQKRAQELCREHIDKLLPALLPPDTDPQVLKVCCAVSTRSATSKVQQWVKANVTEKTVRQGISAAMGSANGQCGTPTKENVGAHFSAPSAFGALDRLHATMRRVQSGKGCSSQEALELLDVCVKSRSARLEWSPSAAYNMEQATFDFVVCLAVWCPEACTRSVLHAAVPLWQDSRAVSQAGKQLYCARNLHLAMVGADTCTTLFKFGQLAQVLLHFDLLAAEDLEESLKSVLDLELPATVLEPSVCVLRSVLQLYKDSHGTARSE